MADAAPLNLAVYVVGFSGHCSMNYVGSGKSCLCRQFMYNEYSEEPCSTLLQAEFDGCVINQQHVIYWGQKEVTYTSNKERNVVVNFDVFEHTVLYQDGTSMPYSGEKYKKRIFAPLKTFLNKCSFRSREEILNPEEYSAKMFTYTMKLQIAYLYVVDVSQSCPFFAEQLRMMDALISVIKKSKHHCVILASKFDSYCKENFQKLEYCASKLKVDVIQSSSKYNTNIDTAFKYLAVKCLQLKKKHIAVNIVTHAECAVEKRRLKSIESDIVIHDEVNIDEIPHISIAPLLRKRSSEDYNRAPYAITTNCKLSTKFNNDDSNDPFDSELSSISHNAVLLAMKRSLSFSGQDTVSIHPLPLSTGTLPKMKKTTYVSKIHRRLNVSKSTSTITDKPLPLLPFESFDNGDKYLSHKNKHRGLSTHTEIAECHGNSCILDEDSDSANPYETVKLRYNNEELEESTPSSPLPNGVNTAVNKATVKNGVSNHYVSMSSTASATKQEDLTVISSDATVLLPYPQVAGEDIAIKDTIEEDVNGELLLDSEIEHPSSSDAYMIDFSDGNIKKSLSSPTSAIPLTNPTDNNSANSRLLVNSGATKSLLSPYLGMVIDIKEGSTKQISSSPSTTTPLATTDITALLPYSQAAGEDTGIKDTIEGDTNGELLLPSETKCSSSYVIQMIDYSYGNSTLSSPTSVVPLTNPTDKDSANSQFLVNSEATKSLLSPHLKMVIDIKDGSIEYLSFPSNAALLAAASSVPTDNNCKVNQKLSEYNSAQSADHTVAATYCE